MDVRHMRYILRVAELSAEDLGRLCGVSRVSAHAWLNGGRMHSLRRGKVEAILHAIESATNTREFPVVRKRGDWRNAATLDEIKNIVLKHLHRLPKNN